MINPNLEFEIYLVLSFWYGKFLGGAALQDFAIRDLGEDTCLSCMTLSSSCTLLRRFTYVSRPWPRGSDSKPAAYPRARPQEGAQRADPPGVAPLTGRGNTRSETW